MFVCADRRRRIAGALDRRVENEAGPEGAPREDEADASDDSGLGDEPERAAVFGDEGAAAMILVGVGVDLLAIVDDVDALAAAPAVLFDVAPEVGLFLLQQLWVSPRLVGHYRKFF